MYVNRCMHMYKNKLHLNVFVYTFIHECKYVLMYTSYNHTLDSFALTSRNSYDSKHQRRAKKIINTLYEHSMTIVSHLIMKHRGGRPIRRDLENGRQRQSLKRWGGDGGVEWRWCWRWRRGRGWWWDSPSLIHHKASLHRTSIENIDKRSSYSCTCWHIWCASWAWRCNLCWLLVKEGMVFGNASRIMWTSSA